MKSVSLRIIAIIGCALLGAASFAHAEDPSLLNRDTPPKPAKVASEKDVAAMKTWLENLGVNSDDSMIYQLLHLGVGVTYPVNKDLDVTVSGGSTFRFGVSF
jgi:hypothetical protein